MVPSLFRFLIRFFFSFLSPSALISWLTSDGAALMYGQQAQLMVANPLLTTPLGMLGTAPRFR